MEQSLRISQQHIKPHALACIQLERAALVAREHHLVHVHIANIDIHLSHFRIFRLSHRQLKCVTMLFLFGNRFRWNFLFKRNDSAIQALAHFRRIIGGLVKGKEFILVTELTPGAFQGIYDIGISFGTLLQDKGNQLGIF